MNWQNVLVKPVISERSLERVKTLNEYAFLVSRTSNKAQIREAVEKAFSVKVKKVRTKVVTGKTKRKGTKKGLVKMQDIKQALVRLAPGDKIGLFEVGKEDKKK